VGVGIDVELCKFVKVLGPPGLGEGVLVRGGCFVDVGCNGVCGSGGNDASGDCAACDGAYPPIGFKQRYDACGCDSVECGGGGLVCGEEDQGLCEEVQCVVVVLDDGEVLVPLPGGPRPTVLGGGGGGGCD